MESIEKFGAEVLARIDAREKEMLALVDKAPKCPTCNGPVLSNRCGLCVERAEQERCRQEQIAQQRILDVRRLGGEKAYREFTLEGYTDKVTISQCAGYPNINLYIWGPAGVGKTHLSTALVRQHPKAQVLKPQHVFRACRGLKGNEEQAMVNKFVASRHLVIDDLGVDKKTDFSFSILYEILDGREMSDSKGLIITSNLSLNALATRLEDDRLASRIAGICRVIELTGKDRRIF